MKLRYEIRTYPDRKAAAYFIDTAVEGRDSIHSGWMMGNHTESRITLIENVAVEILRGQFGRKMSSAEEFYWLLVATQLAADRAWADALSDAPEDEMPEDVCPEIDTARMHTYEAYYALQETTSSTDES
jgi:hypothetical protein